MATQNRHSLPSLPAPGLALTCALHAVVIACVAFAAPTGLGSWFALSLAPLAALHALVFVLALGRRPRALAIAWKALSIYSLAWLCALSWVVLSCSLYLSEIYRGMGRAIAAGLACMWAVAALFTLPVSLWGFAVTRPPSLWRRKGTLITAAALACALSASCSLSRLARVAPVTATSQGEVSEVLTSVLREHPRTPGGARAASLLQLAPVACSRPIAADRLTLLVTALDLEGKPFSACVQGPGARALARELSSLLASRVAPFSSLKLDWVRGTRSIPRIHPLVDSLSLRPALDGLCAGGRCLAPWQLVARDAFTRNRPLDWVRDARFGVSLPQLAAALGVADDAPLLGIETASWVGDHLGLSPLVRLRPPDARLDGPAVDRAVALAGRHILRAQRAEGVFRYMLEPYKGRTDERLVSLRRHAGTTFALCDVLPASTVARSAQRALKTLGAFERKHGDLSMLTERDDRAQLGDSALPLVAFAACRKTVGPGNDALIGGLARFLLAMQRADGAFYPEFELASGHPRGAHESLYASGQALLGLVLVEQIVAAHPSAHWPAKEALADGVERAMRYYGNDYWPRALRSLFYLEENWHCLAARAALGSHRQADYEDFCLDYARFKRRWVLTPGPSTSPEHVGGYSLSDMFPPHDAVTAGFGETLSAAIEISRARGLDVRADQALLREVLGFLLRQQWTPAICFACGNAGEAIGGFSEHAASPRIRIDYVQHAMAALGHGRRALALE